MDSLQKSIAASTSIEESVIPRRRRAMTEGEDKVKWNNEKIDYQQQNQDSIQSSQFNSQTLKELVNIEYEEDEEDSDYLVKGSQGKK